MRSINIQSRYEVPVNYIYFVRLEWAIPGSGIASGDVRQAFKTEVALPHEISWDRWFQQEPVQIAVFVTQEIANLCELLKQRAEEDSAGARCRRVGLRGRHERPLSAPVGTPLAPVPAWPWPRSTGAPPRHLRPQGSALAVTPFFPCRLVDDL